MGMQVGCPGFTSFIKSFRPKNTYNFNKTTKTTASSSEETTSRNSFRPKNHFKFNTPTKYTSISTTTPKTVEERVTFGQRGNIWGNKKPNITSTKRVSFLRSLDNLRADVTRTITSSQDSISTTTGRTTSRRSFRPKNSHKIDTVSDTTYSTASPITTAITGTSSQQSLWQTNVHDSKITTLSANTISTTTAETTSILVSTYFALHTVVTSAKRGPCSQVNKVSTSPSSEINSKFLFINAYDSLRSIFSTEY